MPFGRFLQFTKTRQPLDLGVKGVKVSMSKSKRWCKDIVATGDVDMLLSFWFTAVLGTSPLDQTNLI